MIDKILLGYEMGSGVPVEAKLHHLFISGITQHSGKTTGLESFISQAGLPALVFRTGRGELGFDKAHKILPYFRERTDWRFLEGLLSVHLREKTKIYRSNLMTVSRGADSLQTVWNRVRARLTGRNKARGWDLKMFTEIDQYFSEFMPSLGQVQFAPELKLENGLNVVDLEGQPVALQQMVIAASLERIMENMSGVIVVVPEAYKLIPIDRPSPVRLAAEVITREGMKIRNFLWLEPTVNRSRPGHSTQRGHLAVRKADPRPGEGEGGPDDPGQGGDGRRHPRPHSRTVLRCSVRREGAEDLRPARLARVACGGTDSKGRNIRTITSKATRVNHQCGPAGRERPANCHS